jgi:hypothetical protein
LMADAFSIDIEMQIGNDRLGPRSVCLKVHW